jgi:hypothetical protein
MILIDAPTEGAVRHALLRVWTVQMQHRPDLPDEARALAAELAAVLDRLDHARREGADPITLDRRAGLLLGRLAVHRLWPAVP